MANGGWYGTQDEWDRYEAPLLAADRMIEAFAAQHRLALSKNHKDWPERSLTWGVDARCLIQIYRGRKTEPTWNLWLACSQDRDGSRYMSDRMLIQDQPIEGFIDSLPSLLEEGRRILADWSAASDELPFRIKLAPL